MDIFQRPFSGQADLAAMTALSARFAGENLRLVDLPYRFSSWALDQPENTCLWFSGSQLVAWAVLQGPFWTIDYAFDPGSDPALHAQILSWADQRAAALLLTPDGLPCWFATVFSDQSGRIRDLEQAGFACQANVGEDSWSKVFLKRSAHEPVKVYQPPAGFTVRPLAGAGEVEAYVELHRSVFGTRNMTMDWRMRTLQQPAYRPDLDLVVESPDGRLTAFCIGWVHASPGGPASGQIEPLGCHPDFRRYALGRVALSAVLQRLQAAGIAELYVETDSYRNTAYLLYESLGFQLHRDVLIYRKDYQTM